MSARRAGVLAHPTVLWGRYGCGDIGPGATRFLDWIAECGLALWQMLPLGPTGASGSPYTSPSSFAGNPLLVSPRRLAQAGWLPATALDGAPAFSEERVDFAAVASWKTALLREAWRRFQGGASKSARRALVAFGEGPDRSWLDDWTLYAALKERHDGAPWNAWDDELRARDPRALARARAELSDAIAFHRFAQFVFHGQWAGLRSAARARGLALMGDLPYYPALDSADVWAAQHCFKLDAAGRPRKQAGVPPDYFSPTGQLWGNPTFDWTRIEAEGFAFWTERLRFALSRFDRLRLDHFRGFAAYWEVEGAATNAVEGRWVEAPGRRLFETLRDAAGDLPLVAEDLGVITPEVETLLDTLGFARMHVLQFGFDDAESPHRPERHARNAVVYTGTHDNDTTRGWFEALDATARRRVLDELRCAPDEVVERMLDVACASTADLAVLPLQDLLGLGSAARMNTPGVAEGNWSWRVPHAALSLGLAERVRDRLRATGRLA